MLAAASLCSPPQKPSALQCWRCALYQLRRSDGFRTAEALTAYCVLISYKHACKRSQPAPGLLELSSGVGFRRAEALTALTALSALSVRLVPLPNIDGLARLPSLRSLHLTQVGSQKQ